MKGEDQKDARRSHRAVVHYYGARLSETRSSVAQRDMITGGGLKRMLKRQWLGASENEGSSESANARPGLWRT